MIRFSSDSGTTSAIVAERHQPHGTDQEVAQMRRGTLAVAEALADLPGQLEGDARPAEIAAGIGATRPSRVDDNGRLGKVGADRVVVGHDQLDAELAASSASRKAEIPQSTVTISAEGFSAASRRRASALTP